MSKYIFLLGKDPQLSLAELYAVYPKAHFLEKNSHFALLEMNQVLAQGDLDQLGGVVKLAEVVEQVDRKQVVHILFDQLLSSRKINKESGSVGKIHYGLSVYGWSERNLRSLLLELKKKMKVAGYNSRFANQDFKNLSVAQYKGLCKKGSEWILAKGKGVFYVTKTIAVQDIDAYSFRDYHKPFRTMLVGMLPPKLAQILINLTQVQPNQRVWDPFCGGGVLLMEGLLKDLIMWGSDINRETLKGAQQNLAWLQTKRGIDARIRLFYHDAATPLVGRLPDAVACEGYLGPPQRGYFRNLVRQQKMLRELESLYIRFFDALKSVDLKGPVVIAFPFYRSKQGEVHLNRAFEMIEKLGYFPDVLIPGSGKTHLNYIRDTQWVGRRIMRFRSI